MVFTYRWRIVPINLIDTQNTAAIQNNIDFEIFWKGASIALKLTLSLLPET